MASKLEEYRRKRDFHRTIEPEGIVPTAGFKGRYVIQKHAARQLHYDFRLELGGVLKSWAVPKGPSSNPQDKRLAVQVEDHPLEYAEFEGVIPEKQYGAGTVMLWDSGQWIPEDENPELAYEKGHLHFTLKGSKLQGKWSLVRMGAKNKASKNWLLIKKNDDYASGLDAADFDQHSVSSHRSMDQIKRDKEKIWDSTHAVAFASKQIASHKTRGKGRKAPLSDFISPQLATLVDQPPSGMQWLHEIKYDGYRILTRIDQGNTILFSRNAKDWSQRFPTIHRAVSNLGLASAWLDGEICFVKSDGTTSFQGLQNALKDKNDEMLYYFLFDILYLNGKDLTKLVLSERKKILADLIENLDATNPIKFADHMQGQGNAIYEQACHHKLEGIISKRVDLAYKGERSSEWQKIKCLRRQEFVIGGYTRRKNKQGGFGALLLGVFENGSFVYTGKVGTGFNEAVLQDVYDKLVKLQIDQSQFDKEPPAVIARSAIWVKPELVAEIEFSDWTRAGYLRLPSFKGLREDKEPTDVECEELQEVKQLVNSPSNSVAGVSLTNPEKMLYPQEKISKRDLAVYYENIAVRMLPYISNRPLVLLRCPDGYQQGCFYQKHNVDTFPNSLMRVTIAEKKEKGNYLVLDSIEGLISLVQMGVLEIHTWGARADQADTPDQLTFDIDPQEDVPWKSVIEGAHTLHDLLEELGLTSFVKATGGKGLHVVVPITRRHNWQEVKAFTRAIAALMVQFNPGLYTAKMSRNARTNKMFIDYVRNSQGATAIAPYSTRARANAPIAVPLSWDELDDVKAPNYFTLKNIYSRLERLALDPWENYFSIRQSITKPMRKALGIGQ